MLLGADAIPKYDLEIDRHYIEFRSLNSRPRMHLIKLDHSNSKPRMYTLSLIHKELYSCALTPKSEPRHYNLRTWILELNILLFMMIHALWEINGEVVIGHGT